MAGRDPQLGWRLPVQQPLVLAGEHIPLPQEIRGQIFLPQGILQAESYTGQASGWGGGIWGHSGWDLSDPQSRARVDPGAPGSLPGLPASLGELWAQQGQHGVRICPGPLSL